MRHLTMFFALTVAACKGEDTDASDTDTDTVETDTEPPCSVPESGTYDASGSCFGMGMGVDLTMDAEACTFTLSDWSMNHAGLAEGGTVTGTDVTLVGGDFEGCEGTIDGDTLTGTCSDGCAWELSFGG